MFLKRVFIAIIIKSLAYPHRMYVGDVELLCVGWGVKLNENNGADADQCREQQFEETFSNMQSFHRILFTDTFNTSTFDTPASFSASLFTLFF